MSIIGETLGPQKLGNLSLSWDLDSDYLTPNYVLSTSMTSNSNLLHSRMGKIPYGSLFYAVLRRGFSTQA